MRRRPKFTKSTTLIAGILIPVALGQLTGMVLSACSVPSSPSLELPNRTTPGLFGGALVPASNPIANSVVHIDFLDADGDAQECSGVLISTQDVLTAAHCTTEGSNIHPQKVFDVSSILVKIGVANSVSVRVREARIPPLFHARAAELRKLKRGDLSNEFDIAVLHLADPAPENTKPFALPNDEFSIPDWLKTNPKVLLDGEGYSDFDLLSGVRAGTSALRETSLPLGNEQAQPGVFTLLQNARSGFCVGDSGSPMSIPDIQDQRVVVGIATSVRNPKSAKICHGSSRFVSVAAMKGWIRANLQEKRQPN